MDQSSPLAMQFKQLDADGDGKLNIDEVYELLKVLGKNIYKGSVTSAANMLNMQEQAENKIYFTFGQFKQFFESLDNSLKHDIWKAKYKLLGVIKEINDQVSMKQDQTATAAPGAKSSYPQDTTPFKGDIQVTVGPTNQNYNSVIEFSVEKSPKAESKPFIKIIFEQSSHEKAKQLQQKFKKLQTSIFELIKSADPESSQVVDHIHIITNVTNNKLNIFITTSNQALIQLGNILSQFIDRIIGNTFQAKINFKHKFSVDIPKFMDPTSDYTFYHALTQNYHSKLVWSAFNFKQACKQIFKSVELFKDFQYDKMDPYLLTLIGMLHTEICEVSLVFDNADFQYSEQQTKQEILQGLKEMNMKLSEEENANLGVFEAIQSFENRLYAEASIGDWKAYANIQIKDVKQLFTKKPIQQGQQQNNPVPQPPNLYNLLQLSQPASTQLTSNLNLSQQSEDTLQLKKKSSLKKIGKQSKQSQQGGVVKAEHKQSFNSSSSEG